MAIELGADAIGLVSQMPSGPGIIDENRIAEIVSCLPPALASFLLTCETDVEKIIAQQKRTRANTLQLCNRLTADCYRTLSSELPGVTLVQVIHVVDESAIEVALATEPYVQGILLDSGAPKAAVPELGGTGRVHNWNISRQIREVVRKQVFLAGGLNPENVRDAIAAVDPYGVDICSGVRSEGFLDRTKLVKFMTAVDNAV